MLTKKYEEWGNKEGCGSMNQIFTLRVVVRKILEKERSVYEAFINMGKDLWQSL